MAAGILKGEGQALQVAGKIGPDPDWSPCWAADGIIPACRIALLE
jgi:hypothetical protein